MAPIKIANHTRYDNKKYIPKWGLPYFTTFDIKSIKPPPNTIESARQYNKNQIVSFEGLIDGIPIPLAM